MKTFIAFAVGAAVGSLATWAILRGRYEEYIKEEVKSVKEAYCVRETACEEAEEPEAEVSEEKEEREELDTMVTELNYTNKEGGQAGHPYVITAEQFASENPYYDKISLTLYASGEVEDDDGVTLYNPEEVDNMVGLRNLGSMGEFEKGVLYVRNDILKTDYEVIEDTSDYLSTRSNL